MTDILPYFAGLITILFGAGCFLMLTKYKNIK